MLKHRKPSPKVSDHFVTKATHYRRQTTGFKRPMTGLLKPIWLINVGDLGDNQLINLGDWPENLGWAIAQMTPVSRDWFRDVMWPVHCAMIGSEM